MIQLFFKIVEALTGAGALAGIGYYLVCLWSAIAYTKGCRIPAVQREESGEHEHPPVSILKPLKGEDPEIYESFRSHCLQDYPQYEIIFGVSDANDPAVHVVEREQKVARTERELLAKHGYQPSDEEIAHVSKLPLNQVREVKNAAKAVASTDAPIGSDGDSSFGDLFAAGGPTTEDEVEGTLRTDAVRRAVAKLPERPLPLRGSQLTPGTVTHARSPRGGRGRRL